MSNAVAFTMRQGEVDNCRLEYPVQQQRRILELMQSDKLTLDQRIALEQVLATLQVAGWVQELTNSYKSEHGLL